MNARRIAVLSEMHRLSDILDELKLHYDGQNDDEIDEIEYQLANLEDELDMIDWEEDNQ